MVMPVRPLRLLAAYGLHQTLAQSPSRKHIALLHRGVRLFTGHPVYLYLAAANQVRRRTAAEGKAGGQYTVQPQGGYGVPQELCRLLGDGDLLRPYFRQAQVYPAA